MDTVNAGTEVELPVLQQSLEDDPQVLREAATEDFSGHVVPLTWRSSRGSLAMAWFSVYSAMFWLVLAGTMALAVGTVNTLVGIALAIVVFAVVNRILSRYAMRGGISLALFSRRLFGYLGGALPCLVVAITAVYYGAFESSVIAIAFRDYFGGPSLHLWYLIMAACAVALAIGGVRVWLDKFNGFLLPLYCLGLITAVVWAIVEYGYHGGWFTYQPDNPVTTAGPGWLFAFCTYFSQLLLVMYMWDFARFGKPEDVDFHSKVTFGAPFWIGTFLVNGILGIFLAHTISLPGGLSDASVVLALVSLMGVLGVIFIWITQSRINTANFYVASSNFQSFAARVFKLELPRAFWVAFAGAAVFVFMLTDVLSFLLEALNYQAIFVTGWVAVALTYVLLHRADPRDAEQVEFRPGRLSLVNVGGFAAYLFACAVGVVLVATGSTFGVTWAPVVTALLAAGLYWGVSHTAGHGDGVLERPHDPRAEVDDPWQVRVRCDTCGKSYLAIETDRDPSAGLRPICVACAARSPQLYHAAHEEARRSSPV